MLPILLRPPRFPNPNEFVPLWVNPPKFDIGLVGLYWGWLNPYGFSG